MELSSQESSNAKVNRSTALQMWTIAAAIPLALIVLEPLRRVDFYVLWVASKMALSGDGGQVYDSVAAGAVAASVGMGGFFNFPYPPQALLLFAPFALIPPFPAYIAWDAATAGLFYWAAKPWLPKGFPPILALLTPAALVCLDFGQTGLLFGALWLMAFRAKWPAVGMLTFKPHLGVLAILSIRDLATLLKTTIFVLGLAGVCAAFFGPAIWIEFAKQSVDQAADIGASKRWLFAGVTPAIGYGFWGWIPFAAAGALLLARNVNVFTAATASFLVSPYGFHYDMTVACLGFGLMICSRWQEMPIGHRIPITLGFLAPVICLIGAWWIPPILVWALWIQTKYPVPLVQSASGSPQVATSSPATARRSGQLRR
jgi:hypothetical protein